MSFYRENDDLFGDEENSRESALKKKSVNVENRRISTQVVGDDDDVLEDSIPAKNQKDRNKRGAPLRPRNETSNSDEEDEDDAFRISAAAFTQRLERETNIGAMEEIGTLGEPRNGFEAFLLEHGCELRFNEEDFCYFLKDEQNHGDFVLKLERVLSNEQKWMRVLQQLEESMAEHEIFSTLLSPVNTSFGRQDTVMRALLLTPSIQTQVVILLINTISQLTLSKDKKADILCLACVAQLRYLDFITDSSAIAKVIIEQDFSTWKPNVRDDFIMALPEIIPDPISQEEVALRLRDLLLDKTPSLNCRPFRNAALSSILLLRTSVTVSEEIAFSLIGNAKQFDAASINQIVAISVENVEATKNGFFRTLVRLKENLRVETLKLAKDETNKTSLDEIICQIFMHFPRCIRLIGAQGWKQVLTFFKGSKTVDNDEGDVSIINPAVLDDAENNLEDSHENQETSHQSVFTLFEILVSFSLLSQESCPLSIEQVLRQQTVDTEKRELFKAMLLKAFQYKKFISKNQEGLLRLARRFIWLNEEPVREMGGIIYIGIIQATGAKNSAMVLRSLLSHLEGTPAEAAACLTSLELLVRTSFPTLRPHIGEIKGCLNFLVNLTTENCVRLFRLLVSIYTLDPEQEDLKREVAESIQRFARTGEERLNLWAILGLITQFEAAFTSRLSNRESAIEQTLKSIQEICGDNSHLLATWYRLMAKMLKDNPQVATSKLLLSWSRKMVSSFKQVYITEREENYVAQSELEEDAYRTKSRIWLTTTAESQPCLVPMIQLIEQICCLRDRWSQKDNPEKSNSARELMHSICESNLAISSLATDSDHNLKVTANSLYYSICALIEIMNMFGSLKCDQERLETLQKKYALLVASQRLLAFHISKISEWELPKADYDKETIMVIEKRVTKRPGRPANKGSKKRRSEEPTEDQTQSAFADENNGDEQEENNTSNIEKSRKELLGLSYTEVPLGKLPIIFTPLKLPVIVKLLRIDDLNLSLRESLLTLIANISKATLPKRDKKLNPFNNSLNDVFNKGFHGEQSVIWKLFLKVLPSIVRTMAEIKSHFKKDQDEPELADRRPQHFERLTSVLLSSLQVILGLFEFKGAQPNAEKGEKREQLFGIIEKAVADHMEMQIHATDDSAFAACRLVADICEICPTLEIAVVLSELTSNLANEATDEQRRVFALHLLSFLRTEWTTADSKPLRGQQVTGPASIILHKYILMREKTDRLLALEWMTLVKIAQITSRNTNRVPSVAIEDPLINQQDGITPFGCITKSTFTGVYRAALTSLNDCINDNWAKADAYSRSCTPTECINKWLQAAGIFAALAAMLEHKSLRTAAMLLSFAREGRKFVNSFTKNSSFFEVFEKHTSRISEKAHKTLRAMQIGTRHLQQISLYAKQNKSTGLLRTLPEIRACGEAFLRVVRSTMVKIGCADTVVFGLLIPRDIDGEKIVSEDRAEEAPQEETSNQGNGEANEEVNEENNEEESRTSDVF